MSTTLIQTGALTAHGVRNVARQPFFMAFTLVQPLIYLLLFGALFAEVDGLRDAGPGGYLTYLTPGVVLMTATFAGGWGGMGVVQDHERGRFGLMLATPVHPVAVVGAHSALLVVTITVQAAIVLGIGAVRGADLLTGGLTGIAVVLAAAALLSLVLGGVSFAVAIAVRRQESVIAIINFVLLPLTFSSALFVPRESMPAWLSTVAAANPVQWAATMSHEALSGAPDWRVVAGRSAMLAVLACLTAWAAAGGLRRYRRGA